MEPVPAAYEDINTEKIELESHGGNILLSRTIPAPSIRDVLPDGTTQINVW